MPSFAGRTISNANAELIQAAFASHRGVLVDDVTLTIVEDAVLEETVRIWVKDYRTQQRDVATPIATSDPVA